MSCRTAPGSCSRASGRAARSLIGPLRHYVRRADIDATLHGFRSSFRDWTAENGMDHAVAEAALAHVVSNATEAAYRRTDLFERRRELMEDWADYVNPRA